MAASFVFAEAMVTTTRIVQEEPTAAAVRS
jgi:hypothetical protein